MPHASAEECGQKSTTPPELSRGQGQTKCMIIMARATGLEPATSGVTGRHSNRLSYARAMRRRRAAMCG
jgi:hypothetical protein